MRIPRSKGAVSGLILVVLGAWGALVPLIGPYFDWVIGTDDPWRFSAAQWWLSIVPGIAVVLGGLLLMSAYRRRDAALGAWMALAGGAWFVVGPTVSRLWNDGASDTGPALGGTTRQVLEQLTYFSALGVLIVAIAAFALGRIAAWTAAAADDEPAYRDRRAEPGERVERDDLVPADRAAGEERSAADRRGTIRRRRGLLGRERTPRS